MKKTIPILLILFIVSLGGVPQVFAQNLRLNTYHVSPRGKYDHIRLLPRPAITDSCDAAIEGTLYINSNHQNSLFLCNPATHTWSPLSGVWKQIGYVPTGHDAGPIVSPSDPAPELRVGIGTNTPEFKLSIQGSGISGNGSIVAQGLYNGGTTLNQQMQWAKFIWYPRKAAIMAGSFQAAFTGADIGPATTNFSYSHKTPNGWATAYGKGSSNLAAQSILGQGATIGGGFDNYAAAVGATVAGGSGANSSGQYSFTGSCGNVSGSSAGLFCNNIATSGRESFSGVSFGTAQATLTGELGVMGAIYTGTQTPSQLSGVKSVIGGGGPHIIQGDYSIILGGGALIDTSGNPIVTAAQTNNHYTVLTGGAGNTVTQKYGTILNGSQNLIDYNPNAGGDGEFGTILNTNHGLAMNGNGVAMLSGQSLTNQLGEYNFLQGRNITVNGGNYNVIANGNSVNVSGGHHSFIAGGQSNNILNGSAYAVILGDGITSDSADYSFAAGRNISLTNAADNTFVWSSGANPETISTPNSFIVLTNTLGIQTITPDTASRVDVNGDVLVEDGYLQTAIPNVSGTDQLFLDSTTSVIGTDIAEIFPCRETVSPGDVLVVTNKNKITLQKSRKPYDPAVIGVVSAAPASVFEGSQLIIAPEPLRFKRGKKPPVALAGRVLVKVSLENGPIQAGDLLTTSKTPGHAMRVTDTKEGHHAVLGKALEPFTGDPQSGQNGLIEMMVMNR